MKFFWVTIFGFVSIFYLAFSGCVVHNDKVENLLNQMSLKEKIGQMTQINLSFMLKEESGSYSIDTSQFIPLVRDFQIGSFLSGGTKSAKQWNEIITHMQKLGIKYQNHHIPILFGIDHIHGTTYLNNGTVFPNDINLGCTFNHDLAFEMGKITAIESEALGHHWNFAPVLGIGLNKFWARFYETFGEDPLLCSKMGEAYIKGIQNQEYKTAACAKHYLGYSDPKAGYDRSPAEISQQSLYEFFLPSFKAAVDAGVKTFMINSGEINGIPVHASRELINGLLRGKLGYNGVIITDWEDIIRLHSAHKVAATEKEAVFLAINAGIDISMTPYTTSFCTYLEELVNEGRISRERINDSVRRILKLKYDLALFKNPYPKEEAQNRIGSQSARKANFQAASESIVLLRNSKKILPLDKSRTKKIVIAGPNANNKRSLCGGWSYEWMPKNDDKFPEEMKTLYQALTEEFSNTKVVLADLASIQNKAKGADAIILALGEIPYAEGFGTITDLNLPDEQIALLNLAYKSDKPVITVLIEGRPRTFAGKDSLLSTLIFAGLPGYFGGDVIAQIISGKINPSGKLAFTYPYKQGHILPYYHKHTAFPDMHTQTSEQLKFSIAEFGSGRSYSELEYSELNLSDTLLTKEGQITASIRVSNLSKRPVKETVLWFIQDEYASITRPVKMLKHFEKREILPGENKEYQFIITPVSHLSFPDNKGNMLIEEGRFKLIVGGKERYFVLR